MLFGNSLSVRPGAVDTGAGDTEKIRHFCLSKSVGLVNEATYVPNQRVAGLIC